MPDPNLKIRIDTAADVSGAKAAEAALKDVGGAAKTAEEAMAKLDKKFAEIEKNIADYEAQAGGQTATPPPLPGAGGGSGASGLAVAGGVAGVALAASVVSEVTGRLAEGIQRAAEFSLKLRDMDEASRQAAIAGMGPLGQLLAENSTELVAFAYDLNAAKGKLDDMWTAAGVRLVPALSETADALARLDTVAAGTEIGEIAAGMVVLATQTAQAAGSLADGAGGAEDFAASLALLPGPLAQAVDLAKKGAAGFTDFFKTLGAGAEYDQAFDPARLARQAEERLATIKRNEEAVAAARLEAERTTQEKIEALKARKERELEYADGGAAAIATEREIVALEKKLAKEREAAAEKERQLQAQREQLELETRLNEARAAGNSAEQERLQHQQDYNAALKQTGDEMAAKAAADAKAAVRAAEAAKRAEAETKAEAEKTKAAADKEKREAAAAAKKQEQLDLQIALNEALAAGNKDEAERVRWMQDYVRLLQQGVSEETARRAANASSGARGAAAAARGETDAAVASAAGPVGRPSAPLQQSPLGPSGLNAPIDITRPAQPRGLGGELAARGSEGYGTAGSDPAAGSGNGAAGQGGSGSGALGGATEKAGQLTAAVEAEGKKLEAALDAATKAVGKAGTSAVAKANQLSARIDQLEREIASIRAGN